MKPGTAVLYTVASESPNEVGLVFNASIASTMTHRRSAWEKFLEALAMTDTPRNRKYWMRRGYRVIKVFVTVEKLPC